MCQTWYFKPCWHPLQAFRNSKVLNALIFSSWNLKISNIFLILYRQQPIGLFGSHYRYDQEVVLNFKLEYYIMLLQQMSKSYKSLMVFVVLTISHTRVILVKRARRPKKYKCFRTERWFLKYCVEWTEASCWLVRSRILTMDVSSFKFQRPSSIFSTLGQLCKQIKFEFDSELQVSNEKLWLI